ncbi:uncharacterized protein LACBIDRAFT_309616 [Laccaria bicolor S238N-H82]|uniref:Predicted protein n=1 Tax=Laccaria bicolor (strain S238N-H82 / ATCC MYA-4686) TaxID=486041 RepID=B0DSP0_LACBS|nr:uncharacterized protein LACBIDRAFT_309616 [Laccaria bicolor S238N-H82]EDR02357.1 predicted protein [Laccaria bicolor S238N-H82]|eukprot:XP_001887034.1 predicted protein [Laccaria bicolor S238N-H82]
MAERNEVCVELSDHIYIYIEEPGHLGRWIEFHRGRGRSCHGSEGRRRIICCRYWLEMRPRNDQDRLKARDVRFREEDASHWSRSRPIRQLGDEERSRCFTIWNQEVRVMYYRSLQLMCSIRREANSPIDRN